MTANISTIELFNLLRAKLGEQEARALTDYVAGEVERKFEDSKNILATKEDLYQLERSLRKEISELRVEMRDQKAEMIKWMFIFWIGQIGATLGIVFLFFKK